MTENETGWLPDLLYAGGRFQSGLAVFVNARGAISRFSAAPEELRSAQRLQSRALIPGLVNVHSHAFQRCIRARTEHKTSAARDTFWSWRDAMYHAATKLSPEDIYQASAMAFCEMLLAGITTVGEFHYLHHAVDGTRYANPNLLAEEVTRAARDAGIRIVLLNVAYARAGWQREANPLQARFITDSPQDFIADTERLRASLGVKVGIAPHSIRAVPSNYLTEIVRYARSQGLPVHMHVAEQPAETEACLAEYGLRPVELLDAHGVLDHCFTAVHATHATGQDLRYLGRARASICVCPTTERNLGDGIAPADQWKAAEGINVCFGSDSNIQIDLLEDARELEYHLRLKTLERAVLAESNDTSSLARWLFDRATEGGATALGLPTGAMNPGAMADFFTVDLDDPSLAGADESSLLSHIVFGVGRSAVRDVFVAGRRVIAEGRHAQQEQVVARFKELQRRLWV